MIRYVFAVTGFALIGSMALAQGTPAPESGAIVDVAAVPFSEAAVNGAFMRLSEDERYVLQQRLERRGFYQGTVDGLTGPGTREAIRQQAAAVLSAGQEVRLDTEEGARTFLTGLLPMPAEELPEGEAFFGVWDCGIGLFSYRYDGYATDPDAPHIPYMAIEAFSPGTFGVTLMDGYRMGVFEPPRVYRRVKLSKDEPYGPEEAHPEVHSRVSRARCSAISRTPLGLHE